MLKLEPLNRVFIDIQSQVTFFKKYYFRCQYLLGLLIAVYAGLSPSTQYRVTVRSKQLRAPGQAQPPAPPPEEAPGAYTDFRTLAKGLPDPPQVN